MKILVTGTDGQLGKAIKTTFSNEKAYEVLYFNRNELNIVNYDEVLNRLQHFIPDVIINCAAYTNVEGAENDYKMANEVNHFGAMNIARAAETVGAKLVHISTDYVFNGKKNVPYFEHEETNPLQVYGKTKLAGEWAVRNECNRHFIIRTSWLYGRNGKNFVNTMIDLAQTKNEFSIVCDQIGSPTNANDLAKDIGTIIKTDKYGIYHYANRGHCSWYDFACEIFKQIGISVHVNPVTSDEYNSIAKRPAFSVLDTSLIQNSFDVLIPTWQDSLREYLQVSKMTEK